LRTLHRDILILTGERDSVIPAEHVARVRSLLPRHDHLSLPAEHNLLLTHPEQLMDALLQWRR
jgi:pimeloyl-ACP methyl ester carboxylesterase